MPIGFAEKKNIGDFNGDGKMDLMMTNGNISIGNLLNIATTKLSGVNANGLDEVIVTSYLLKYLIYSLSTTCLGKFLSLVLDSLKYAITVYELTF